MAGWIDQVRQLVGRAQSLAEIRDGLDALRKRLLEVAGWQSAPEGLYLARARHVEALQAVDAHLEMADEQLAAQSAHLDLLAEGWTFRTTRLTEEYTLEDWHSAREGALPLAVVRDGRMWFVGRDEDLSGKPGMRLISLIPPEIAEKIRRETEDAARDRETARAEARALRTVLTVHEQFPGDIGVVVLLS